MLYTQKFLPGEIFCQFAICFYWLNFYHANSLPCVNDYIDSIAPFTVLVKSYSTKYFCNTKVAGLGEISVQRKFCHIRYSFIGFSPCNNALRHLKCYYSILLPHYCLHVIIVIIPSLCDPHSISYSTSKPDSR